MRFSCSYATLLPGIQLTSIYCTIGEEKQHRIKRYLELIDDKVQ